MRRKEKEIIAKQEIEDVIRNAIVCRIGMCDGNIPYIAPLCFGYQDDAIYVHGALEGKKINILRKNQNVCFEFDISTEIVETENACNWGMKYKSVIGFGKASFIDDPENKRKALKIIMAHYSDRPFAFSESSIHGTAVIKIEITSMTGKQSKYE